MDLGIKKQAQYYIDRPGTDTANSPTGLLAKHDEQQNTRLDDIEPRRLNIQQAVMSLMGECKDRLEAD